jgi:AcrR family transcriptional regulator
MASMKNSLAPQQDRSIRTQQTLLDALEHLLKTHPFDELTVAQIASEAGLTTGAIYRRFSDKRALLGAAFARFADKSKELQIKRTAAIEKMDDVERIRYMIKSMLRFTIPYIPLMRAASTLNDEIAFEHMRTARNSSSDWLAECIVTSTLDEGELHRRTRFAMRTITAVIRDTYLAGPGEGRRGKSIENMVNELTAMTAAYLKISQA